ncbi:MAG TPA: hypothetical protein VIL20_10550, partial [Sandaracinaceae bacterium]
HAPEPHGEHAGESAEHADHHHHEPHESPDSMTVPLIVLAAGAVLVGFLGLPHAWHLPNWWSNWLTPQYEAFVHAFEESEAEDPAARIAEATNAARTEVPRPRVATLQFDSEDPSQNVAQMVHAPTWVALLAMFLGTLAGLLGLGIAWLVYVKRAGEPAAALRERASGLHRLLMNKWYVDELYGATVVAGSKMLAVFAANFDRVVVDGLLAKASAALAKASGYVLTRTQTGAVYAYASMFVLGLAGLLWWFTYPHADLRTVGEETAGRITWEAGRGLGYEYRWDFDSDGEWDTDWTTESTRTFEYEGVRNLFGLSAILTYAEPEPSVAAVLTGNERRRELVLEPGGDPQPLPVEGRVPVSAENDTMPTVAYRNVVRVEGRLPAELQPEPNDRGERRAQVALSILGAGDRRIWGPEIHEVRVEEGGSFAVLLGAHEYLGAAELARAREVAVEVNGRALPERLPLGEPDTVLLLRINGAMIPDNDGLRDGLLALEPGRSVAVGHTTTLSVGLRVRATVLVRNTFGNQARSTKEATLRVSGSPARTAQLGAREENGQ